MSDQLHWAIEQFNAEHHNECPAQGRHGVDEHGNVYFQSNCSDDAIIARMLACEPDYLDPYEDEMAFRYNMRRLARVNEFCTRERKRHVTLGSRVNRVPAKVRHW